jgi:hypothetical protein
VEPSKPGSDHKPYDDLADLERVFDTKETSNTKKGIFFEAKKDDDEKKKNKPPPTFGI